MTTETLRRAWLAGLWLCLCAAPTQAQFGPQPAAEDQPAAAADEPEPEPPPKSAPSRVAAVTVYRGNALVTREVTVPEGKGLVELTVTPLPPATIDSSLYTEGTDGIRVLSTRFRSRAVRLDTRAEVRAKLEEIKTLQADAAKLQKQIEAAEQNLGLVGKLENFTAATLQNLTEKGQLSGEATIELANYVMKTRDQIATEVVALQQQLQANREATEFANRELNDLSSGTNRTERDAVIVVDKANAPSGTVRLNYLVGDADWTPQYRVRAGADKDPVQLEYLAAIEQKTGEDWPGVEMTLSTAQPMLNAAPPDLLALDITVIGRGQQPNNQPGSGQKPGQDQQQGRAGMMGMMGGGMGGMGGMSMEKLVAENRIQARAYRGQAQQAMIGKQSEAGQNLINAAAALEQAEELLVNEDDAKSADRDNLREGPSVTFHLKSNLTVPSRTDVQLIEVARIEMTPDYFFKAVPVLTPHVYRLANLTNTSDYVLLPGDATMYQGSDFVGRMALPLVAIGEQFTVGLGVDPQLQVFRQLVDKSKSIQGGNQVHSYDYRIAVRSYKSAPVQLQVWDRLPRAETENVAVSLVKAAPDLSGDATYQRISRPENLLRWDLTVPPETTGEKTIAITYEFKLEYARDVAITNFKASGDVDGIGGGAGGGFR